MSLFINIPEDKEPLPSLKTGRGKLLWIASTDHKQLGIMYLWLALFFFVIGGLEAMAIRAQLALPDNDLISPELYNQIFTMHGTTMIFAWNNHDIFGFNACDGRPSYLSNPINDWC